MGVVGEEAGPLAGAIGCVGWGGGEGNVEKVRDLR